MTKFILHGGQTTLPLESNKKFFRDSIPEKNGNVKVLIVYFARKLEDYEKMFSQDKESFLSNSPGKNIELEIADQDIGNFRKQIINSDIIYVRGGNTFQLIDKMRKIPEFSELIEGKIYLGSSAGMYLVSKYFYNNDTDQFGEGLGILKIKAIAHWTDARQKILNKLENYRENLPVYKVKEGEYIIIEQ